MRCHLAQLRVSLAAVCALLLTLLATASVHGESSSPDPTRRSPETVSAIIGNGGSADANSAVAAERASRQWQASVVLTPAYGLPGTVTTAHGSGFAPYQPVAVAQSGGLEVTGGGGTIRADQSGSIIMSFRITAQAPPGVITVAFTQGENAATAKFRVRRSSSGIGGALAQPIKGTGNEISQWLNACLNGRLNIPVCTTGGFP
jgi:hypothetical protein